MPAGKGEAGDSVASQARLPTSRSSQAFEANNEQLHFVFEIWYLSFYWQGEHFKENWGIF